MVARKGKRNVVARTSNNKDHMSIVACVNGAGRSISPLVIAKGKTRKCLESFAVQDAPDDTRWTFSETAWTNDILGRLWFRDVFVKQCGDERPQLLVMDGHSSHKTSGLIQHAKENGITILALPPYTTSELQPLDKVVFKPFKNSYNRYVYYNKTIH